MDKKSDALFEKAMKAVKTADAATPSIKLTKIVPGKNAHYTVDNMPQYFVMRREKYFNRADGLKGIYLNYHFVDRNSGVYVSIGSTLKAAKRNFSRYLSDLEENTLGPASRYGHYGDSRPIQTMTQVQG